MQDETLFVQKPHVVKVAESRGARYALQTVRHLCSNCLSTMYRCEPPLGLPVRIPLASLQHL